MIFAVSGSVFIWLIFVFKWNCRTEEGTLQQVGVKHTSHPAQFPSFLFFVLNFKSLHWKEEQSWLSLKFKVTSFCDAFLVLELCEGWSRLKSGPFMAVAAELLMKLWSWRCVYVCVYVWYHGKVLSSGQENQTEGWDVDNWVNFSIKSNGYLTPHRPDIQPPSVVGFVPGRLPANNIGISNNHNLNCRISTHIF